jgi:hypothetical protein
MWLKNLDRALKAPTFDNVKQAEYSTPLDWGAE